MGRARVSKGGQNGEDHFSRLNRELHAQKMGRSGWRRVMPRGTKLFFFRSSA